MSGINNNPQNWNSILKEFRLHLIPMLNPEGYLISSYAIRKLIPREMSQEEAEKIAKKYADFPEDTIITSRQENHESIHRHNAFAEKVTTMGELKEELRI